MLGYGALFVPRNNPDDERIETQFAKEVRKSYVKLDRDKSYRARYTSCWQRATFNDVCSASVSTCSSDMEDQFCVGHLFTLFEAQKSFRKFSLMLFSSKSGTPLSFLPMFDTIITKTIDLFKFILKNLRDEELFIGDKNQQARAGDSIHHPVGTKSHALYTKGGVISHSSD